MKTAVEMGDLVSGDGWISDESEFYGQSHQSIANMHILTQIRHKDEEGKAREPKHSC